MYNYPIRSGCLYRSVFRTVYEVLLNSTCLSLNVQSCIVAWQSLSQWWGPHAQSKNPLVDRGSEDVPYFTESKLQLIFLCYSAQYMYKYQGDGGRYRYSMKVCPSFRCPRWSPFFACTNDSDANQAGDANQAADANRAAAVAASEVTHSFRTPYIGNYIQRAIQWTHMINKKNGTSTAMHYGIYCLGSVLRMYTRFCGCIVG